MSSEPARSIWSWERLSAVGVVVCGLSLVAWLVVAGLENFRFQYHGIKADAKVVEELVDAAGFSHSADDNDSGTQSRFRHRLRYEYTDQAGRTHLGEQEWVNPTDRPAYRNGEVVHVRYLPDAPEKSQIDSPGVMTAAVALLVAVPVGTLIIFLAVAVQRGSWLRGAVSRFLERRAKRRRREDDREFPYNWERILRQNVGHYPRLGEADRLRLQRLILRFLDGKAWEGCLEFEITDEVRVTVAGQACVLLLGEIDHDYFASVKSVLIYPTAFSTPREGQGVNDEVATLGQAWYRGPVLLAWDDVLAGGRDPDAGRNVVYHEFAHQLDFAGETVAQAFRSGAAEKRHVREEVMAAEYQSLVHAAAVGRPTLIDAYGATNTREFFAVVTECFFGRAAEMHRYHERLYEVLREYYGFDPERRFLERAT